MRRHPTLIDAADLVRANIRDDVDELLAEFLASDTVMIILIFEKVRQILLHERKAVILCHRRYAHILKHFQKQANWTARTSSRAAESPRAADPARSKNLLRDRCDPLRPRSSRSAILRGRQGSRRYPAALLQLRVAKRPCRSRSHTRRRWGSTPYKLSCALPLYNMAAWLSGHRFCACEKQTADPNSKRNVFAAAAVTLCLGLGALPRGV